MRPLGPVARASSASARRIALYVNTKSINSPTKSSSLIGRCGQYLPADD
jgi:hypothetical protein